MNQLNKTTPNHLHDIIFARVRATLFNQQTPTITCNSNHIAHSVIDKETGQPLEYKELIMSGEFKNVWAKSYAHELGQLTQGIRDIPGKTPCFS